LRLIAQADRMFVKAKNYHQRGETNMTQGVQPFKYEEEKNPPDFSLEQYKKN